MVGISLVNGENLSTVPYAIFAQIVYGVAIGVVLARIWYMGADKDKSGNKRYVYGIYTGAGAVWHGLFVTGGRKCIFKYLPFGDSYGKQQYPQ